MKAPRILLLVSFACLFAAPVPASAGFEGRRCAPPTGHRIADCRVARHGTPDLSRAAWRALRGTEVTVGVKIESLAPNFAAGGARSWPLVDSLGRPMGSLEMPVGARGFLLRSVDGNSYR